MVALLQVRIARPNVHGLGQMASYRRLHPEVPIPKHNLLSLPRLPNFSKRIVDNRAACANLTARVLSAGLKKELQA